MDKNRETAGVSNVNGKFKTKNSFHQDRFASTAENSKDASKIIDKGIPIVTVDSYSGPGVSSILKKTFNLHRSRNQRRSYMLRSTSKVEIHNTADIDSNGLNIVIYPRRNWSPKNKSPKFRKKRKLCVDKSVQTESQTSIQTENSNIEPFWDRCN